MDIEIFGVVIILFLILLIDIERRKSILWLKKSSRLI